jgi:two-component system chemotaxis response regulator CheB
VLDDGTAGLKAVKTRNGVAVVQHPDDAMYSGMPRSAIANVDAIDHIMPLSEIPAALVVLANTPVSTEAEKPVSQEMEIESELAEMNMTVLNKDERPAKPSPFACPDCGGTSGIFRKEICCGSGVALVTLCRQKLCWLSSLMPWKMPCGLP